MTAPSSETALEAAARAVCEDAMFPAPSSERLVYIKETLLDALRAALPKDTTPLDNYKR